MMTAVTIRLVAGGNTVVVVVEHNLDVVVAADWIGDLGPEGARRVGRVVARRFPPPAAASPAAEPPESVGQLSRVRGRTPGLPRGGVRRRRRRCGCCAETAPPIRCR